jgi:hypothetical protein
MKQSAGRGAESIPTSDCTCVRTIHAPGVVTANEPMGGSTVCPAATARATVPILGTTISSRRGARTASPLPLRGRVAVQFDPKLLYPRGAESLRARARRCLFPSAALIPTGVVGETPFAPAPDVGGGRTPTVVRCRLRPWASSKSMGTGEGEVP